MNLLILIICALIGYLLGSISFARVVLKLVGAGRKISELEIHVEGSNENARVEVSVMKMPKGGLPFLKNSENSVCEQLLPAQDVGVWLRDYSGKRMKFPITETIITSYCQGGLLLFNPETREGHIYLLKQGFKRFQCLYRLL